MYCTKCGHKNNEGDSFCAKCGASTGSGAAANAAPTNKHHTGTAKSKNTAIIAVLCVLLVCAVGAGIFFFIRFFIRGNTPVNVQTAAYQSPADAAVITPESTKADVIGTANAGDIIAFGGNDWLVLEVRDGKALVLSKKIIGTMMYHEERDMTWADSDIRKWLNGDYLSGFTADERNRIVETRIENDDNQWYNTNGGGSTQDKIFLLSIGEVVKYFGDSGQLRNGAPNNNNGSITYIDDNFNSARMAYDKSGSDFWWWLRSPGGVGRYAALVFNDGQLSMNGANSHYYYDGGVRPALWLDFN